MGAADSQWTVTMKQDLAEVEYQRFWRALQHLGLNAYEARSYLVLLGHSRFKALELAPRAHVPRQKIYEVLDSLVEKGFASVVQDKTKLFSAVEPNLAIPAYLARKRQLAEQELTDQARSANNLMEDLSGLYSEGKGGGGPSISSGSWLNRRRPPPNTGECWRKSKRNIWSFRARPMQSTR